MARPEAREAGPEATACPRPGRPPRARRRQGQPAAVRGAVARAPGQPLRDRERAPRAALVPRVGLPQGPEPLALRQPLQRLERGRVPGARGALHPPRAARLRGRQGRGGPAARPRGPDAPRRGDRPALGAPAGRGRGRGPGARRAHGEALGAGAAAPAPRGEPRRGPAPGPGAAAQRAGPHAALAARQGQAPLRRELQGRAPDRDDARAAQGAGARPRGARWGQEPPAPADRRVGGAAPPGWLGRRQEERQR
jgi:hypothetical protein